VIHAGIYCKPGSAMAKLCVEGVRRMYEYCGKKNLPHQQVGKLIVATWDAELPILEELYERAMANGVPGVELISSKRVQGQLPSPFSWLIDSPEEFICSSFHNLCNLHLNWDLLRKVGSSRL